MIHLSVAVIFFTSVSVPVSPWHHCSRLSAADIVDVDCQSWDVSTFPRAAHMLITLHCTASVYGYFLPTATLSYVMKYVDKMHKIDIIRYYFERIFSFLFWTLLTLEKFVRNISQVDVCDADALCTSFTPFILYFCASASGRCFIIHHANNNVTAEIRNASS